MENKDNNYHLDLLQLYKICQEELSFFDLEENAIDEKANQNLLDAFMVNRPVLVDYQQKDYVSPLLVMDVKNHIYYPLCFFKIKKHSTALLFDSVLPLLNTPCIEFLKSLNIPFEENFSMLEVSSWYTVIHSYIYVNYLSEKIKIIPYFTFHDKQVLSYNSNYLFLNNYIFGKETPQKYDSLFKEVKNEEVESQIKDNSFGFFAREQRIMDRLSSYYGAKTMVEGKGVFDNFIWKVIETFNEKKESAVFIVNRDEKENLAAFLKDAGMAPFCVDLGSLNENQVLTKIQKTSYTDITPSDEIQIRKMREKETAYLEFCDKKEKEYHYPKVFRFPHAYQEIIDNYQSDLDLNILDITDYTEEDSEKDGVFFNELDSLDTIKSSYISNHPFYGLSLSESKESFTEFHNILQECVDRLKDLMEAIESKKWINDYHWEITSFQHCQELIDDGKVLSQYNGFPRKYFRINESNENKYDLDRLKKAFQAVSSTRLLMESLFGEGIFHEDISKLLEDYQSRSFLVKRKAKKILSSYLSYQKEADYDTAIKILDTYQKATRFLNEILPEYQKVYGDNVSNMNGVVEIESNIRYIRIFNERQKENVRFSTEEPCIKRCLKDKAFRLQIVSDINDITLFFDRFNQSIKDFNNCFRGNSEEIDRNISFVDMLAKLESLKNQDYEPYYQYAHFRSILNESSTILQLMVRKNMAKKNVLTQFKRDYYLSLLKSFQYRFESQDESYTEDYYQVSSQYLEALKQEKEYAPKDSYSKVIQRLIKESKQEEYLTRLRQAEEQAGKSLFTTGLKRELLELLIINYPVSYVSSDELYLLPDDLFDNAVIINSSSFSSLDLLSSYRVGKKCLFIAYGSESDKRVQGYHETGLNKDSLYYKQFDFSSIYETFAKQLSHLDNVKAKPATAFPIIIRKNRQKFAFLPDLLMKYPLDGHSLLELSRYLAREENVYLLNFDVYYCLFDNQDIYLKLMENKRGD